jgi:ABC-type glycerol-3-phosphate transport system permease component
MHLSAVLPQNSLASAAIAAVPPLLMYLLVERQFARSEITGPILPPRWAKV